ncbi:hypothetical protein HNR51_003790 [Methylorubrum thiocyanatum]|jgi:putative transposase|uniref:HTH-like domain-containing protein n=1 Tax=Methylorubrum thiocyanatum TaxID=47958 RepID=A0AA40VC81_9HYPH|nr:hypothetical protein [Methylorubrum thiocyanatum]GJE81699.1 hypothetical protein CJNNKLLH_3053 [Methylorubrum thiocyanatum]
MLGCAGSWLTYPWWVRCWRTSPRETWFAPERRRQAVDGIREKYGLSERHACRIVGQHRGTQCYVPTVLADEDELTRAIVALASEYGRYGYRRVTALLQADGWQVGKDRVQRDPSVARG